MREEDPGDVCNKCKNTPKVDLKEGEDFYINEKGLFVFKAEYHLKRGYCCESGCKHCPY
ncbi:MAG: DUF5522 domain-containing protein [Pseudobdellovibrionaceae bacterium]